MTGYNAQIYFKDNEYRIQFYTDDYEFFKKLKNLFKNV